MWERLWDSVVGAEGVCGGGGGGGSSGGAVVAGDGARLAVGGVEGGVEAVVLVASWGVLGWALAEDRMLRSPGAGGAGATVEGVGSESAVVVEADV